MHIFANLLLNTRESAADSLCFVSQLTKNLRSENEDFSLDFWMLRTKEGKRLSRAKRRKALKKNTFGLFRIIFANLFFIVRVIIFTPDGKNKVDE